MGEPIPALIRQLEASEWRLLRRLRLAALEESPDAFSPTLEEALGFDSARWQRGARRFGDDDQAAMFIARPDRGLCSAVMDGDPEAPTGHIGAMWVSPDARGEGLGSALLDTALGFLSACPVVELTVTQTNTRARALYESRGFRLTDRSDQLRPGSPLLNLEMKLLNP